MSDVMGESVRNAKAAFKRISIDKLRAFIARQHDVYGDVIVSEIEYPSDGAGSTNGIGLFDAVIDRGGGAQQERLVVRYLPGPALLAQKSFDDEFATLQAVRSAGVPSPCAYWLDSTGEMLGVPGYVMERIEADKPTASLYSTGPFSKVEPATRNEMMLQAAGFHGALKKKAIRGDRVRHLLRRGPEAPTAVQRELGWWMEEVRLSKNAIADKLDYLTSLHQWMVRHEPNDLYAPALVHGDAQFANLMYKDNRLVSALDWELSFIGHNESDLALLSFITESQKKFDIPAEGTPTEYDFISRFEVESGQPVNNYEYFKLFCMLKVQSIALMTIHNMPDPEAVWNIFKDFTEAAWSQARTRYDRSI
ncbi:phosphotransferase family protein [Novosphingobium sp. HII-3]|uniref:phosphotransferase family protein n=1 Tax=Novosphingobium sp. HII-3 TaxID=2075565 RepID=UPI001E5B78E8|nr:phosphotransferase family protein [Novosphingobium sp. HII-3]